MKKIISMLLAAALLVMLAACSNRQSTNPDSTAQSDPTETESSTPAADTKLPTAGSKELDDAYAAGFDLEKQTVTLNNGVEMPIIGIGTFMLSDKQAEDSVYWALRAGYHLIDTAAAYGNEAGVGRGVQRAIDDGLVTREDVFITTKLWPADYSNADAAINARLDALGVEYIDLLLLHQAMGDYEAAYKAMEKAVADGRVRSIGISNFYGDAFENLMSFATITPAVLQNEMNPTYQQVPMREIIEEYGIRSEAWFPLGGRGHTQEMFSNPVIVEIAKNHDVSSAQVVLRWHMQVGSIAIPGSSNEDHIKENIDIFGFSLTEEEMEKLRNLDTGVGTYDFGQEGASDRFTGDSDWVADRANGS